MAVPAPFGYESFLDERICAVFHRRPVKRLHDLHMFHVETMPESGACDGFYQNGRLNTGDRRFESIGCFFGHDVFFPRATGRINFWL
jgi:hypothetical protein